MNEERKKKERKEERERKGQTQTNFFFFFSCVRSSFFGRGSFVSLFQDPLRKRKEKADVSPRSLRI
tara:strand:+ start:498 stop:695 length:198 start_codon:yes stop_codon:yes gene_type:complete